MLSDKPPVLNPNFSPPWFGRTLMARKASARYVSPPRAPVTSESLGTALRSGGSCQENKRILVKIHPQGKEDPFSGQKPRGKKNRVQYRGFIDQSTTTPGGYRSRFSHYRGFISKNTKTPWVHRRSTPGFLEVTPINPGYWEKNRQTSGIEKIPINPQYWTTGSNLLHETNFHRFLSGKSVFRNSKFQIREFRDH